MNKLKLNFLLATMTTILASGCGSTEESEDGKMVYYDFDKADIKNEFVEILNAEAEFMKSNADASATIEGHCDSRGTPEYNMALGDRRANAIKKHLEKQGVTNTIEIKSYGEEKPAVPDAKTEEEHKQNRRAVIIYN